MRELIAAAAAFIVMTVAAVVILSWKNKNVSINLGYNNLI